MRKLMLENGLLYTSVRMYYRGRVKTIDKVVMDIWVHDFLFF